MLTFHIISIFPNVFSEYLSESIIGRAKREGHIKINCIDLRDYAEGKRKNVDDTPYGGGAGMVMSVEPIYKAVLDIKKTLLEKDPALKRKIRTVVFAAKGNQYKQKDAARLSKKYEHIILICGRYEGIDERVLKYIADEEIAIGEYVLTGGELPAMVLIDSVTRLLPEVLGNQNSLTQESFSVEGELEYPQYTRPEVFENPVELMGRTKKWKVPKVLLSGHHGEIEKWRKEEGSK